MSKKVTLLGLTLATAMLLSYVEALIPPLSSVPGVKIGLANIAVIFAIYRLGAGNALFISLARVLLSGLLFGNIIGLAYSACGALFSFAVMIILKKTNVFSVLGVSIAGGVSHNAGQIAAAVIIMGNGSISYYLPALIISGTAAGAVIGIVSGLLLKRFEKYNINFIK